MPNELTPARMRELIAAATPGPWEAQREYSGLRTICTMRSVDQLHCINIPVRAHGLPYHDTKANSDLIVFLVNNAPALADALEVKALLDELVLRTDVRIFEGGGEYSLETNRFEEIGGDSLLSVLRAAKEAADAK